MNRDRWSSDYDNVYASDTSGYADPLREAYERRHMGDRLRQDPPGPQAWRQQHARPQRLQPSREKPSRREPSWGDESRPQRDYAFGRPFDDEYGPDVIDDETSGYAQGYAGYGQGHGDTGPQPRQGARGLEMGYGRYAGAAPRRSFRTDYGPYRGKGPKGYKRSDDRIRDDVCEALMLDPWLDASRLDVTVQEGVVTLDGVVGERYMKYLAEDCAAHATGVRDVDNRIRLDRSAGMDRPGPDVVSARENFSDDTMDT